jgi:predicted nucleotidyltransferase
MKQANEFETRNNVDEKIIRTYPYGSRVYGCHTEDSDYDYILVVDSHDANLTYNVNYTNTNLKVYSEAMFIEQIKKHHISALECIFQDKRDPYLKYFKLDKPTLRRSISAVSSNSFVKCKKKLKDGEFYIGKKSLFHSLRILGFGIQIALTGRIVSYSAYNHYLHRIIDMDTDDWKAFDSVFKSEFNRLKTNFREFAPLEDN